MTRPCDGQQKKENLPNSELCHPGRPPSKNKGSEKRDKYLGFARELKKKLWNMKLIVITIVIGALGLIPKGLGKILEDVEIKKQVDHPDYSIIKICQNIKKSPGDLRRISVTQIPVRNHQLMLV